MKWRRIVAIAIVIAFSLNLFLVAPEIPQVKAAGGGLALDPLNGMIGLGSSNGGGFCTLNQNLTTTQKPDVIVALLVINDTTASVTKVSDTAGLSWTHRTSQMGPANVQIISYYAITSTVLVADNMTFVLNSGAVATDC